jgi:EAL domain-containing protein (putative c-di-GMP-specific phosphodiesterase class I)
MGCSVAIDDFGTGYASYARLKNVNADILKIDGSFIRNIVSNSLDYQIVASICHLAHEKYGGGGVCRNEEIRSAVVALGIDYLQGYLIANQSRWKICQGRSGGLMLCRYAGRLLFFDFESPAGDGFPVLLFPFQVEQHQRILAEPVVREAQRPVVIIGLQRRVGGVVVA